MHGLMGIYGDYRSWGYLISLSFLLNYTDTVGALGKMECRMELVPPLPFTPNTHCGYELHTTNV